MSEEEGDELTVHAKLNDWTGELSINLLNVINEMSVDSKASLLSQGGWYSLFGRQLAKDLIYKFSRESYDHAYTELRELLLNSAAMPQIIVEWVKSVSASVERNKEESKRYQESYRKLYSFCRKTFPDTPLPQMDEYVYVDYSKELIDITTQQAAKWGEYFSLPVCPLCGDGRLFPNNNKLVCDKCGEDFIHIETIIEDHTEENIVHVVSVEDGFISVAKDEETK